MRSRLVSKEGLRLVTLALRGLPPWERFVAEGLALGPVGIRLTLLVPGVVVGGVFRLGVAGVVACDLTDEVVECWGEVTGDGRATGPVG